MFGIGDGSLLRSAMAIQQVDEALLLTGEHLLEAAQHPVLADRRY